VSPKQKIGKRESRNRAEIKATNFAICTTMLENFRALRKFFANQSGIYSGPKRQERKVTGLSSGAKC
jgi:hypothetical protein